MDIQLLIDVAGLASHIILENGGETYRAEETAMHICEAFGADVQLFALPTGVFITVAIDNESRTAIKRVKKRTTDLSKLEKALNISRAISKGTMDLEQAKLELQELLKSGKKTKRWVSIGAAGLSSGFFALLFGGGFFDFIIAFACGLSVWTISTAFKREDLFHFMMSLFGGMAIALIATLSINIFHTGNANSIIAGAMMPLLPGLAMTNAIRDTMRGDLVSGVSRGAEALLIAVALAIGAGVMLKLWLMLGGVV